VVERDRGREGDLEPGRRQAGRPVDDVEMGVAGTDQHHVAGGAHGRRSPRLVDQARRSRSSTPGLAEGSS
jgi:hypothetical protein